MDVITQFTKSIGNAIAKIKSNNLLIEELRKKYNPTFSEIMEILEVEDPTLATMLMLWYNKKYNFLDAKEIEKELDIKKKESPKTKSYTLYSYSSGCGNNGGSIGCK